MPWRPQWNLFTPSLCVFYQSGSKIPLLPDRETPCKGSSDFILFFLIYFYIFKRELGQSAHPKRAYHSGQFSSISWIWFITSVSVSLFLAPTGLTAPYALGVLKGSFYLLLNPAESVPFQKTFPSPGAWLSLTSTTAVSPLCWCLLHFAPLLGGHAKAEPCRVTYQLSLVTETKRDPNWGENPRSSHRHPHTSAFHHSKPSLGSGQKHPGAPRPFHFPTPFSSHANYQKYFSFFFFPLSYVIISSFPSHNPRYSLIKQP